MNPTGLQTNEFEHARRVARRLRAGRTTAALLAAALLAGGCSLVDKVKGQDDKVGRAADPTAHADDARKPFLAALDDLATRPALKIKTTGTDRVVTREGIQVGTAQIDGETVDIVGVLGDIYIKPSAATAARLIDPTASPDQFADTWFLDTDELSGPSYIWAAPPALAQTLRRALAEADSAQVTDATVDGKPARKLDTPAGSMVVTRDAPHTLVRFTPAEGPAEAPAQGAPASDARAADPASAPGAAATYGTPDLQARAAAGPSENLAHSAPSAPAQAHRPGAHRAAPGLRAEGDQPDPADMNFSAVPDPALEGAYNDALKHIQTFKDKQPLNPNFRLVKNSESVQCSMSGCTVNVGFTPQREPRTRDAAKSFEVTQPINAQLTASFTVGGASAGSCVQATVVTEGAPASMTCTSPTSGAVVAQKDAEAKARAQAAAGPGKPYQWQVPYFGQYLVVAIANFEITAASGYVEAARDNRGNTVKPDRTPRTPGTQAGAEAMLKRSQELHKLMPDYLKDSVVAVTKVRKIGAKPGAPDEFETWVTTSMRGAPPAALRNALRPGEVLKTGPGHAERTMIDNLYVNGAKRYQIVEGASNFNVCVITPRGGRCQSFLLIEGLLIGGQIFPWRAGGIKSDYRTFYFPGE